MFEVVSAGTFAEGAAAMDPSAAATPGLVWQNTSTGARSIWHMSGTRWAGQYSLLQTVAVAWRIAATADFDADGDADLVWQNVVSGDRSIWLMVGSGWQGDYALLPRVAVEWEIAAAGDFTGDGKPDLVWENTVTGDRSIWHMNGASWPGGNAYTLLPRVAVQWRIAAAADFTGDGKPDLVWQNAYTGSTGQSLGMGQRSIWHMNGTMWGGQFTLLQTVPVRWRIAAAADYTGDNKPDLVWQNVSTGERSIWHMNGTVWGGQFSLLTTVPVQWEIAAHLAPPPPPRATKTWLGGTGAWDDAANWSPSGVPTASDTALIAAQTRGPFLTVGRAVGGLVVSPGAALELNDFQLFVSGRSDLRGAIASKSGVGSLYLRRSTLLAGSLPTTEMEGPAALAGDLTVTGGLRGGPVDLAGRTLTVNGNFGGAVLMDGATDVLVVSGDAHFGAVPEGRITAGRIIVAGNFRGNPFQASGTNLVVLNGATQQALDVGVAQAQPMVDQFQHLEIANPAGVALNGGVHTIKGDMTVSAPGAVTGAASVIRVRGNLTMAAGSSVTVVAVTLWGALSSAGTFAPTSGVNFAGVGQIIPVGPNYRYTDIVVSGSASPAGDLTVPGNLKISQAAAAPPVPSLDIAGRTVTVNGRFDNDVNHLLNGGLLMDGATDVLIVRGVADFGAVPEGRLTAGRVELAGDLAGSFHASGTHKVVFRGTARQTATGAQNFQDLEIANPAGLSFLGDNAHIVRGDMLVSAAAPITATETPTTDTPITLEVLGRLSAVAGSSVTVPKVILRGALSAAGTFAARDVVFGGLGQTIPTGANYQYTNIEVAGSAALDGNLGVPGNFVISSAGRLTVPGYRLHVHRFLNLRAGSVLNNSGTIKYGTFTINPDGSVSYFGDYQNDGATITGNPPTRSTPDSP